MIDEPGDPGIMASLARSLLARLLARQGDHARAGEVLAVAAERVAGVEDTYVSGPVAVAQVELGWLDGSLGSMTDAARRVLQVAARTGHASIQAELSCYLRRAGVDVPDPVRAPGPWAPTIAGDWDAAAAGWAALGERYEEAVVLATAPDLRARERGVQILVELGAAGTLLAV
jgi:hypothetical protein